MGAMSGVSPQTIWNRPVRGTRGPHRELSRDQIATAAIELADAGGLRSVTSRRRRGRGNQCRRVVPVRAQPRRADRADGRRGAGGHDIAHPEQDWERQWRWSTNCFRLAAHSWLSKAAFGSGPAGPHALRYFDGCLAIMVGLPASAATKMEALAMLTGVVSLFARAAASQPPDPRILFAALDPQAHPHLTTALAAPDQPERQPDLFQRTLTSVLSGLLRPPGSGGPAGPAEQRAAGASPGQPEPGGALKQPQQTHRSWLAIQASGRAVRQAAVCSTSRADRHHVRWRTHERTAAFPRLAGRKSATGLAEAALSA